MTFVMRPRPGVCGTRGVESVESKAEEEGWRAVRPGRGLATWAGDEATESAALAEASRCGSTGGRVEPSGAGGSAAAVLADEASGGTNAGTDVGVAAAGAAALAAAASAARRSAFISAMPAGAGFPAGRGFS